MVNNEHNKCQFCNPESGSDSPYDICEDHFSCNWCSVHHGEDHHKDCLFKNDSLDNWRAYL